MYFKDKRENGQRQFPRFRFKSDASIRSISGNTAIRGLVLDGSEGGWFFQPESGYIDGEFTKTVQLEDLNGKWRLTVGGLDEGLVVQNVWSGHSEIHNVVGGGFQVLANEWTCVAVA